MLRRALAIGMLGSWLALRALAVSACVGDCDGDGRVRVNELVVGVNVALGNQPPSACAAFDRPESQRISIDCAVAAVRHALFGCPTHTPTPVRTPAPTICIGCVAGGACSVRFEGVEYPGTCGDAAIIDGQCYRVCLPHFPDVCRDPCSRFADCLTIWGAEIVHGYCNRGSCVYHEGPPTPTGIATATPTRTFPPLATRTPSATASPTRTCQSAAPPRTCPPGEVNDCRDTQCFADCSCATPTPAPTACRSPQGCEPADATATATPSSAPELSLAVHVVPLPLEGRIDVDARISHLGGPAVSYLAGCSATCRPAFYDAISFEVRGADGQAVLLSDPCAGPYYCPEYLESVLPGASLTQTLHVAGIAWLLPEDDPNACHGCVETGLAPGRYSVVARFAYRVGCDWSAPLETALTATTEFDWPPQAPSSTVSSANEPPSN